MGSIFSAELRQPYVQPVLTVFPDDESLPADGKSETRIRARMLSPTGNPIPGVPIDFSLNAPQDVSFSIQGTTNSEGEAIATLRVGETPGTALVTATFSSLSASSSVEILGLDVTLDSGDETLPADGVSTTSIVLVAKAQSTNVAVVGKTVTFSTTLGTIPATATTNSSGEALVLLKSGTTSGTATVTAKIGAATLSKDITFTPTSGLSIDATSSAPSLLRDGTSTVTIQAKVLRNDVIPVTGRTVAWSKGTGTPTAVSLSSNGSLTNDQGVAVMTLQSDTGVSDGFATVVASVDGVSDSVQVSMEAISLELSTVKTSLIANGTSSTAVSVLAKTLSSDVAIVGRTVTFSTNLGTIPASAETDAAGVAHSTLTAGTSAGTSTITARLGGVTATSDVTFTATSNVSVEVSSQEDYLLRDGAGTTLITARVVDGDGNALTGRVVTFSLSGGGSLSSTQPKQTDGQGIATVTLRADSGISDNSATVTASSEGQFGTVAVPLNGITLVLTGAPTSLVANGSNTSRITLLAKETTSNAGIPGKSVQFGTDLGTIPASAVTNSSGLAVVDLRTGTTPGPVLVSATLGAQTATTGLTFIAEALSLNLTAESDHLLRDGTSRIDLSVTVQDPNGNYLNNRDVKWSVSGAGSVFPTVGQSGVGFPIGTHSTRLLADSGASDATATVTVTVGDSTSTIPISLKGITLTSFAQPDTILANGNQTATVNWTASETTSGATIVSHPINITKLSGPSVLLNNASTLTSTSGTASVQVTSTTNAGNLVMQAELGGITKSQSLHVLQDQLQLDMRASKATLRRDGSDVTAITVYLSDRYGDPVVNQRIDFALTGDGVLNSAFERTDNQGRVAVDLTADVGSTNSSAQVTASVSTASTSLTIPLYGVTLAIKANPGSIVADGVEESTIKVTVKEAGSNTPLVGRTISFAAVPGTFSTITALATTDDRGVATAVLTADTTASTTLTVVGRLGTDPSTSLSVSTSVGVSAPQRSVSLNSEDARILRNSQDETTVSARLTNNNGDVVSGETVVWSLISPTPIGAALSVVTSTTDLGGIATVMLQGDSGSTDATASVRAAVGASADTLDVTLQGLSLLVAAQPKEITANGVDESEITATLKESTSGRAVSGELITFSSTLGTIGATATTNSLGKATVTLTADTTAGTATINAYSGPIASGISASTTADFVAPSASSLALAASPSNLQVRGTGGTETSDIAATVLDKDNQAVPSGLVVVFSLSPSGSGNFGGTATTDTVETDASGKAVTQFQAGTLATDVTITAKVLGTSVQSSRSLITVISGPTTRISLSGSALSENSNGLYQRALTALLADTYGNAIPDRAVVWTASADSVGSIVGDSATDAEGQATSVFTYVRGRELRPITYYATNQGVIDSLALSAGAVTFSSSSSSLLRDGVSTITATARATEALGAVIGGLDVGWSISAGTGTVSSSTGTTGSNGQATVTYTADADSLNGSGTVQASIGGSLGSTSVTLRGVSLAIQASKDPIINNGTDSSSITVTVTETVTHNPVVGKTVSFATDLGTVTASATTDSEGKATATLKSTAVGTATVTATFGSSRTAATTATVSAQATTVGVSASSSSILRDGVSTSTITATATDNNGDPLSGQTVGWSVSAGTGTVSSSTGTTGSNGQATVTYTADADSLNGSGTVQASIGGSLGSTSVTLRGVTLTLSTSPDTLSAGGTNKATITLEAIETVSHNPLASRDVVFASTLGVIPSAATTNATGLATAELSPGPQSGTATVYGTVGGLADSVDVVIVSGGVANLIPFAYGTASMTDSLVTVTITTIASDSLANPVVDAEVRWSATPDSLGSVHPETRFSDLWN